MPQDQAAVAHARPPAAQAPAGREPADPSPAQPPGRSPAALPPTDPARWEALARSHAPQVYRLAYRLTGNPHDAEDLTQEVFVRVFRSLSEYTPGSFEGWLHRVTTNLFLDQVRRRRRIRFEALPDDAGDRLPGGEPPPDVRHDERSLDGDVQAALDRMTPEFRAAVVLCDVEGLTYEEVAAALGIKVGTVRSRIHRGRAQLRAALVHRAPRGAARGGPRGAGQRAPGAGALLRAVGAPAVAAGAVP